MIGLRGRRRWPLEWRYDADDVYGRAVNFDFHTGLHKASDKCPGPNCDFGKRTQRCNCLATNSLLHTICKATKAKKRLGKSVRLDVVRLIETADKDAGGPAPPSRVVIKLPRYDYDEIIDALEGEEDDAADSDAGEDYELAG